MSLDIPQLREYIIAPALKGIGLWTPASEILVAGTGDIESRYMYVKQLGGGPALSPWQIEPATYSDTRDRTASKYPALYERVQSYLGLVSIPIDPTYLMGNLAAAAIFCRLKYYLHPDPLPPADNHIAMATYHKKIYNTSLGKADPYKSAQIFKAIIRGIKYPY